ncbi:MAG TPA: N-6 DNA methylase, partial [bacterium]|nr:N-6 DNA methylase [bacterium]
MTVDKHYWQINTEKLAEEILHASREARTEEDLKMKVEPLLKREFNRIGVGVDKVRYEKHISLHGKPDAVYGFLVIEYKSPGKLSTKKGQEETSAQVIKYLEGESQGTPHREDYLEQAVGVALDGQEIIFIRYTKTARLITLPVQIPLPQLSLFPLERPSQGFQVQGPFPVNSASLTNLLIFIRASDRKRLTATDLADSFRPESPTAHQLVSELYSAVSRGTQRKSGDLRTRTFFNEWDRIFGVVYGQELEKAENVADKVAMLYGMPQGIRLKNFLFAIHTYYALLMKLMALELVALQHESRMVSLVQDFSGLDDEALRLRLIDMENGQEFSERGITNFLEADFFYWYLDEWGPKLAGAIRGMVRELAKFEPATPVLEPEWTRDLLQNLYELIVPIDLRRALGEYYTPDWLAEYLVAETGYDGDPDQRFLDPACGSGTFLIKAINLVVQNHLKELNENPAETAAKMLNNIVGFDINPLAVLAARTNYLISFAKFLPHVRPVTIPVYLCDSIVTPSESRKNGEFAFDNNPVVFPTSKVDFKFPHFMLEKKWIDRFTEAVEQALKSMMTPEVFLKSYFQDSDLEPLDEDLIKETYGQIRDMEKRGENGIWARYIKNAFAPAYLGKFDFVIGNPPWIRWGLLSDEYRERTLPLWHRYGLFSLKGHETRLGGGEKDFSMLFTYACADNYLEEGGRLGFLITIEAFKAKGAGEGFRRFIIPADKGNEIPLSVLGMYDMVHLQPFHAANKTSLFVLEKGKPTRYPVAVKSWRKKPRAGKIKPTLSLKQVLEKCEVQELEGWPIDPKKPASSWQTATKKALKRLGSLKGKNIYVARLGARVEPYGVFWLKLKEVRPDGKLVVENWNDRGKMTIRKTTQAIEPDLVYPAVSGGDIKRFGMNKHFYLLIAQDPKSRAGYSEEYFIQNNLALTLGYLVQFKKELSGRAAYKKYFHKEIKKKGGASQKVPFAPYWSMYNISDYTFAKYRVVWKRMASRMEAVVLSRMKTEFGMRPVIATDTTSLIALDN